MDTQSISLGPKSENFETPRIPTVTKTLFSTEMMSTIYVLFFYTYPLLEIRQYILKKNLNLFLTTNWKTKSNLYLSAKLFQLDKCLNTRTLRHFFAETMLYIG